jgi:hypothetical protein
MKNTLSKTKNHLERLLRIFYLKRKSCEEIEYSVNENVNDSNLITHEVTKSLLIKFYLDNHSYNDIVHYLNKRDIKFDLSSCDGSRVLSKKIVRLN